MECNQFVSFVINNKIFGLDIGLVNEIYPKVELTPVPQSDPEISGLVNIRGQVVLVLDISVVFGEGERPVTKDSHIIILKTRDEILRSSIRAHIDSELFSDKRIGFLVDSIGDVLEIAPRDIEPPPSHLEARNYFMLKGIVRLENELVTILNVSNIIRHSETEAE